MLSKAFGDGRNSAFVNCFDVKKYLTTENPSFFGVLHLRI